MTNQPTSIQYLDDVCKNLVQHKYTLIDPKLPEFLDLLNERGADECWHKCGTFKEHLFQVWRVCALWGLPTPVCRLALFHSSYSNSYVNLALFDRSQREYLKGIIGEEAEEWVYLFCVIPRHEIIFDRIMKEGKIPDQGMTVKHIITGEDVHLSRYQLAVFMIMTIADVSDQWFGWQDQMTGNDNAAFLYGNKDSGVLWIGQMRPGLFMSFSSRLGKIVQDAQIPDLLLPPIFKRCSIVLDPEKEVQARDLYWRAVTEFDTSEHADSAEKLLKEALELNPYVPEIYICLGQIFIQKKDWEKAEQNALSALKLLQEWGTTYDKRITWEAKIAWARVMVQQAKMQTWPKTVLGMINLGLVK